MRTALLLTVVSFSALASSKPLSWVVFQNEGQHQLTYSDGTSDQDVRRAKAARAGRPGSLFWFHSADGDFAITDPATVKEIVGALEPVNLIGRKMEALGEKEGELGEKQGALGEKLGDRAEHRARRATKAAAATERRGDAAQDEGDEGDDGLENLTDAMKTLGQQMSHLGKQLETFGKEMEAATQKMRTDVAAIVARASAKGLVYSVGKTPTVSAADPATH